MPPEAGSAPMLVMRRNEPLLEEMFALVRTP